MLFTRNVPHLHEKIFLSLDYELYKICLKVSKNWHELLTSDLYQTKAKVIFKNEITVDERKLRNAAFDGNVEEVTRLLFSRMLDINSVPDTTISPLHVAARYGHEDVVILLLNRGAEINKGDKFKSTPLHVAAFFGHINVVQILLDRGAEIKAANQWGGFPLHEASRRGHKDIVKLLKKMQDGVKMVSLRLQRSATSGWSES